MQFIKIYILWLRQIKRFTRSKSRIVGSLAQPLLFLLALGYGFGPVYQKAESGDYLNFLAPGVIGMSIIFTAIFSGMEIIWDKNFGFLKETLVAPIPRFSIMMGRTLGGATVATIQGLIVMFCAILAGFDPVNYLATLYIIPVMFLLAFMFAALGTIIASQIEDMHGFPLVMNLIVMPLFFLSGAIFPLKDTLPKTLLFVAKIDPLSYGIDAFRHILINSSHFGLKLDLIVLTSITIIFLFVGSYLFSKIEI